jgi:hypothetical protein
MGPATVQKSLMVAATCARAGGAGEIGVHERVAQHLLGYADGRVTKESSDSAAPAIDQAVNCVVNGAGESKG